MDAINSRVSLHLAMLLHNKGYNKYSEEQYVKMEDGYGHCSLSLDECLYIELKVGKTLIYIPTIGDIYNWINSKDSNWLINVMWDSRVKGYYFIVQNKKTGYEYKQPPTPGEENSIKMYEWGFEHILNRL